MRLIILPPSLQTVSAAQYKITKSEDQSNQHTHTHTHTHTQYTLTGAHLVCAVALAGVDGAREEVAVACVDGLLVVGVGEALLRTGQIERHHTPVLHTNRKQEGQDSEG